MAHFFLYLLVFFSFMAFPSNRRIAIISVVESANLFEKNDRYSKVLGVFPLESEIHIKPGYEKMLGEFFYVEAISQKTGNTIEGFVLKTDFEEKSVQKKSALDPKKDKKPKHDSATSDNKESPWSLGLGLTGTSNKENTSFVLTSELRYLWVPAFESSGSVDLSLGTTNAIGLRLGQRVYAPLETFRPYVGTGYRIQNNKDISSSAIELNFGFQVVRNAGAYFELGATYLFRTVFDSQAQNYWVFGGASGIRF
jgi:hypothetical protein